MRNTTPPMRMPAAAISPGVIPSAIATAAMAFIGCTGIGRRKRKTVTTCHSPAKKKTGAGERPHWAIYPRVSGRNVPRSPREPEISSRVNRNPGEAGSPFMREEIPPDGIEPDDFSRGEVRSSQGDLEHSLREAGGDEIARSVGGNLHHPGFPAFLPGSAGGELFPPALVARSFREGEEDRFREAIRRTGCFAQQRPDEHGEMDHHRHGGAVQGGHEAPTGRLARQRPPPPTH